MSDGNTNIVGANSLNRLGFALFDDIRQSENAAHRVNEMDLGYDEEWEGLMKKYPRVNFVSDVAERLQYVKKCGIQPLNSSTRWE